MSKAIRYGIVGCGSMGREHIENIRALGSGTVTAIAATVIGGASLSGARGSVLGTVLGTLLMGLITNVGVHLNIDPFLMQSITCSLT